MFIPLYPEPAESTFYPLPWKWAGPSAPDGDADPWKTAPLGSEFTRITAGSVAIYVKVTNTPSDLDWAAFAAA